MHSNSIPNSSIGTILIHSTGTGTNAEKYESTYRRLRCTLILQLVGMISERAREEVHRSPLNTTAFELPVVNGTAICCLGFVEREIRQCECNDV